MPQKTVFGQKLGNREVDMTTRYRNPVPDDTPQCYSTPWRGTGIIVALVAIFVSLAGGCKRSAPAPGAFKGGHRIEVRVMADDGCALRCGRVYGEILCGEDPKTAEQVARWETPRSDALKLAGLDFTLPEIVTTVASMGGDVVTVDVPGPGVYWVRAISAPLVEDTQSFTVQAHAGEDPYKAAERHGLVKGVAWPNPDDRGPPGKITNVIAVPAAPTTPGSYTEGPGGTPFDVSVSVTREYCYLLPPTLVRTHVADDEQYEYPDRVLVIIPGSVTTIRDLHRTLKSKSAVARHVTGDPLEALPHLAPLIGGGADYLYPIKESLAGYGRGAAITVLVNSVAKKGEVRLTDLAADLAQDKIVTEFVKKVVDEGATGAVDKAATGALASFAVSVLIDWTVSNFENAQLQDYSASDDFEVRCTGSQEKGMLGDIAKAGGIAAVKNHGEPMFDVQVVAAWADPLLKTLVYEPLPRSPSEDGLDRQDMSPGSECSLRWTYDARRYPAAGADFRGFYLAYTMYPNACLDPRTDSRRGKACRHYYPLEILPDAKPGPLRITSLTMKKGTRLTGEKYDLPVVEVVNLGDAPVYLNTACYKTDLSFDEYLIRKRQREGVGGPFILGLEKSIAGKWELCIFGGDSWLILEPSEKDVRSIPTQAYFAPGQKRTFGAGPAYVEDIAPPVRAFILNPARARIDEQTLGP
jgi:hypothetical protein